MKKTFSKLSVLLTLFFASSPQADEISEDLTSKSKYSVSFILSNSSADVLAINQNASDIAYGFELSYNFHPTYSVKIGNISESGIGGLADALTSNKYSYTFDSTYLAVSAKTQGDYFGFASLGYANTDEKLNLSGLFIPTQTIADQSSSGLYWELGAGIQMSKSWNIALGYSQISADIADIANTNIKFSFRF